MIELSLIIPHYNASELLNALLYKLLLQDEPHLEIIVIDDSLDESIDLFAKNFYNMKVIHNKSRVGVSKARNQGIDLASGKYIGFIDADDSISEVYVSMLLKHIKNNRDVIVFSWYDEKKNKVYRNPTNYAVWKAIYKKSMIPRFNEKLTHKEDVDFQEKLNEMAYTMEYIDVPLYYYNSGRVGSLYWEEKHGVDYEIHDTLI